jgi:hypothetical protein
MSQRPAKALHIGYIEQPISVPMASTIWTIPFALLVPGGVGASSEIGPRNIAGFPDVICTHLDGVGIGRS